MNYNNIGDEGGKAIGEALKVNTSLTKISLRGNKIGDEGAKAIGEALKVNTITYRWQDPSTPMAWPGKSIEMARRQHQQTCRNMFPRSVHA